MSMDDNPPPKPASQRFVEAVVVCDNYGDFLAETLPFTMRAVNRLVIVTGKHDKETQRLCAEYDVNCVIGWNHRRGGFDKAKAINHGLAHLGCQDWLLHIDADIVLPDVFGDWFQNDMSLDEADIYGVDRYNCKSADDWDKLRNEKWMHYRQAWRYMVYPPPHCVPATRVTHGDYDGWVPIGYFQLWHSSAKKRYAVKPGADMEHTDLLHAVSWPPENRHLIPEFYAVHLSTDQKTGQNWHGRKSPRFRPN